MDDTDNQDELPFYVDRAKGGRANCKGCKQKCLDGEVRLAKVVPSPYSDGKKMKSWYHVDCLMTAFLKQRPTTKRIDGPEDIGNWENISEDDRDLILEKLKELEELWIKKYGSKPISKKNTPNKKDSVVKDKVLKNTPAALSAVQSQSPEKDKKSSVDVNHKDNSFREFRRLCAEVTNNDAYTAKTAAINKLFTEGTDGKGFKSDVTLWCRLLLPGAVKRVYNLRSKQLVKLFSRIFHADQDDMLTDLENGDVAETIRIFHEKSTACIPAKKSLLNLYDVDVFLEKLATLTKEEEQIYHFKTILKKCTSNDLKMIIRLVKGDLRINSGPKHILEAVHPDAYTIFQSSRDIEAVISRVTKSNDETDCATSPIKNSIKANLVLMTPVLPMLAEACKSVEMAMKKCPNGMYSEIKYDGERVQLHKEGSEFKYFSRALKPVMPHKINRFKDYIPKAFPHGTDLILDAEVLMVDTKTGKPLPFGSLGIHKKSEFKDAEVCLFVFDCIYYNGEILIDKPMRVRRKILEDNMVEVKNHVMFSEMELIRKPSDLATMIAKVLKLGLEGLVLKDLESKYEPGKRHWLKVKKDYLFGGAMADSADLVVLGAWFGSGKKGGMLSVFLMGCYDEERDKWLTVTKVHTGHDDKSLEELQEPLREGMIKISQDSNKVPSWLHCTNTMVPDFVAKDPKKQPVWEITGTEITQAQIHTADGLSVRFPRVTRIRDDKSWDTATNLQELKLLYKNSKEHTDVSLLNKLAAESKKDEIEESSSKVKVKKSPREDTKKDTKKIDEIFKKEIKFKEEVGKLKSENIKSENIKSENVKLENVKSENVKSENVKLENVKSENVKSENFKSEKVKINKLKKEGEDGSEIIKNERTNKLKRRISNDDASSCPPKKIHLNEPSTSSKREPLSDKDDDISDDNKKYSSMYSPLKPLPNIFKGWMMKFYIDDTKNINNDILKDYLRYWVAYGGKLDESADGQAATHVVHFTNEIDVKVLKSNKVCFSKSARHVTVNWLRACFQSKRFECTRMYSVLLRSCKSRG